MEDSNMTSKVLWHKGLFLVLAATLGLGLMTADAAWAKPGGRGGHWGGGGGANANLTPEQAGQIFDLRQNFDNDTVGLRRQMTTKRAELATLRNTQNPDQGQISAKQQELWTLREQMQAKAASYRAEAGQIAPGSYGPGQGRGFGQGKGRGRCW
jgi:Spy/CpxP family protein refolding chaperone